MARGVYTPTFEIRKDGEDVTANFQNRATSISVELIAGDGSQDSVTLTVDDRDWLLSAPHVGDQLQIYLGYREVGLAYMGSFEIDDVAFSFVPKQIQVHGNAVGFNSKIKSPTVKNFDNKTVKEILEEYGSDLGLQVVVDSEIGSKVVPYFTGTASPLHVIGQFEKMYGAVAKISNGRLSFASRDSGLSASGLEIPLVVLRGEHIANCQVRHFNRYDYTKTEAVYRDKTTKKDVVVDAQSTVNGVLGQGESGGDKPFRIKNIFPTKEEAETAAKSQMATLDRKLGEGLFQLAQGDPWLRDGDRLLIRGTRDGIDGDYIIDIAQHAYTKDGAIVSSLRTQVPGGQTAFASLYNAAPDTAIAPDVGQVTGEVRPLDGGVKGADPDPR